MRGEKRGDVGPWGELTDTLRPRPRLIQTDRQGRELENGKAILTFKMGVFNYKLQLFYDSAIFLVW